MAYCPKCRGEMDATAPACPHCKYDFVVTAVPASSAREGFAFSPLADLALIVSSIAAALGAFVAAYFTIAMLVTGDWYQGLVTGPLAFFLLLGMLVVFLRVQQRA